MLTRQVAETLSVAVVGGLVQDTESQARLLLQNKKYEKDPILWCETFLKETYSEDIKELMRSVAENVTTIAQSANAVGKTHVAARIALWFISCTEETTQVYTAAAPPESNLKRLFWGEMEGLYRAHRHLFENFVVSIPSMRIVRKDNPQSFIEGVAIPTTGSEKEREARFSGKHAPRIMFIFDEGDAIPPEVYRGAESCVSGGFSRVLINFNPRFRGGAPYIMIKNRAANVVKITAFNHPNVIEGSDNIIPGAVTREKTARRINKWTRCAMPSEKINPNLKGEFFIVPEYMDGYRAIETETGTGANRVVTYFPPLVGGQVRIVVDPAFSYMVLAEFPGKSSNQLISEMDIEKACQRYERYLEQNNGELKIPYSVSKGVAGADISDLGEDTNTLFTRFAWLLYSIDQWKGVTPDESATYIINVIDSIGRHLFEKVNVDSNGVGAGAYGLISKSGIPAKRIMVQKQSLASSEGLEEGTIDKVRDEMIWKMGLWFKNGGAAIPRNEKLIEELLAITYYTDKKTRKIKIIDTEILKKILQRSPDLAMGLAFTFAPEPDADNAPGVVLISNYAFSN